MNDCKRLNYIGFILVFIIMPQWSYATDSNTLQFTAKLDLIAPIIKHEPVTRALTIGETATISATVTDQSGVQEVSFFFRPSGTQKYTQIDMLLVRDNLYTVTVPSKYVQGSGLEYYIKAVDVAGNTVLRGLRFSPMTVVINAQREDAPSVDKAESPEKESVSPNEAVEKVFSDQAASKQKWVLWGVGAIAAGLAAYSISKNSSNSSADNTGSVTIVAPTPSSTQ